MKNKMIYIIPGISLLLAGYFFYLGIKNPEKKLSPEKRDVYKSLEAQLKIFIQNAITDKIGQEYADLIRQNALAQGISNEAAAAQARIYTWQEVDKIKVNGEEVPREVYNALYFNYVR